MAGLCLKRTSATTALDGIRVLESEALFFKRVVPIDGGAIEVQGALFINDNRHAMTIVFGVGRLVEAVIEIQCVAETAATTCGNADSQQHFITEIMFGLEPANLFSRSFG